jgi:hypothetical protein
MATYQRDGGTCEAIQWHPDPSLAIGESDAHGVTHVAAGYYSLAIPGLGSTRIFDGDYIARGYGGRPIRFPRATFEKQWKPVPDPADRVTLYRIPDDSVYDGGTPIPKGTYALAGCQDRTCRKVWICGISTNTSAFVERASLEHFATEYVPAQATAKE